MIGGMTPMGTCSDRHEDPSPQPPPARGGGDALTGPPPLAGGVWGRGKSRDGSAHVLTGMISRRSLLALPAALAACAAPPPPPPPPPVLDLTIAAGADQNPDPSGHPTPVAVRLYMLAGTGRFERADVFALTEREAQTLGDQSLGSEEVIVRPGETRNIHRELKPGVQFLGVGVLFRDIDRARWRAVSPLAPHGPTRLMLKTSGVTATLAGT